MKWLAGLTVAASLFVAPAYALDCNNATTQVDMNMCANEGYERVDKALNALYSKLKQSLKEDAASTEKLTEAQRAWIAFRDKECAFVGAGYEGGSLQPYVVTACKTELTEFRNEQLGRHIDGDQN